MNEMKRSYKEIEEIISDILGKMSEKRQELFIDWEEIRIRLRQPIDGIKIDRERSWVDKDGYHDIPLKKEG